MEAYNKEWVLKDLVRRDDYKEGYDFGVTDGISLGIEQGIKQGVEQGITQNKIEIARNMLKEKFDFKPILKITSLSLEEINKIENS